jgi:hypothetical protein
MYEGIWPMTFEAMLKGGIRFFSFKLFKDWYQARFMDDPNQLLPIHASLMGGAVAGTVESLIIVIPCEFLKVRHMTQAENKPFMRVFFDIMKKVL